MPGAPTGTTIHAVLAPALEVTPEEAHGYLEAVRAGDALLLDATARLAVRTPLLQARVVERLAATATPAAPASELEPLLTSAVARVEAAAGGALLDRIREQGVWGFGPTLEAVQEGRIHVLAVPWRMSARVFRCSESGRVTVTPDAAERLCPGEAPREVPLADVLPDLVSRHAIKLAVMHGDNETRLTTAFDGLAGLTRW